MRLAIAHMWSWLTGPLPQGRFGVSGPEAAELVGRDIDLAMGDLGLVTRHEAGPEALLPRRLELAGLDPDRLAVTAPRRLEAMQDRCLLCPHWRRCARELERMDGHRAPADYCLNACAIDQLAAESAPAGSGGLVH